MPKSKHHQKKRSNSERKKEVNRRKYSEKKALDNRQMDEEERIRKERYMQKRARIAARRANFEKHKAEIIPSPKKSIWSRLKDKVGK